MKSAPAGFADQPAAPSSSGTRSLRRVDWRFLLPAPSDGRFHHMVVLGGNETIYRGLLEVDCATYVSGLPEHVPSADAVIVLAGAVNQLASAAAAAADGAVLYVEVDRRRAGQVARSPGRLARDLRGAGVTPIGSYWVIPGFATALRYVPLDHAGALTWYLRDVFRQSSFVRTAASRIFRALASLDPQRVGRFVPSFSIVAVKGARAVAAVPTAVAIAAPGHAGRAVSVALITSGQDDGSRAVLLPFEPGSDRPAAAIKAARHRIYNDRTAGEHAALRALRSRVGATLQDSLPTPEALVTWNGVAIAVESCAPGATISARLARRHASSRHHIDDLVRTATWITRFNQVCSSSLVWSWSDKHRWIDAPLDRFRGTSPMSAACADLLGALEARASRLLGRKLPLVVQHNDLGPWNVHRDEDRLMVIDWETEASHGDFMAERIGLPMTDLVYFATHWLFEVRRLRTDDEQLEAFRDLFARGKQDTWTRAVRQVLDRYATEMDIAHEFIPFLVALTWIQRANDRLGRSRGAQPAGDEDHALRRFRRFIDALAPSPRPVVARAST
jgi:hypothetical protein